MGDSFERFLKLLSEKPNRLVACSKCVQEFGYPRSFIFPGEQDETVECDHHGVMAWEEHCKVSRTLG